VVRGRRVVDGSSTAAEGHERQEPHQLPAHALCLYLGPRPALRSPLSLASLSCSIFLDLGQFFLLRERESAAAAARPCRRLLTSRRNE
jgi:hypothetical protein